MLFAKLVLHGDEYEKAVDKEEFNLLDRGSCDLGRAVRSFGGEGPLLSDAESVGSDRN